ncbi:hypothetical protein HY631_04365 [Candidatus Uhrbacteria bacterium]|nr:hypothetical protein [Candidatus Uhrbacteria bacterium]
MTAYVEAWWEELMEGVREATNHLWEPHLYKVVQHADIDGTAEWLFARGYGSGARVILSTSQGGTLKLAVVDPIDSSEMTSISWHSLSTSGRVVDHWHIVSPLTQYHWLSYSYGPDDGEGNESLSVLQVTFDEASETFTVEDEIDVIPGMEDAMELSYSGADFFERVTGTNDHFLVHALNDPFYGGVIVGVLAPGTHSGTRLIHVTLRGALYEWGDVTDSTYVRDSRHKNGASAFLQSRYSEICILAPTSMVPSQESTIARVVVDDSMTSAGIRSAEVLIEKSDCNLAMPTVVQIGNCFLVTYRQFEVRPEDEKNDAGDIMRQLFDSDWQPLWSEPEALTSSGQANRPHTQAWEGYIITCWTENGKGQMRVDWVVDLP